MSDGWRGLELILLWSITLVILFIGVGAGIITRDSGRPNNFCDPVDPMWVHSTYLTITGANTTMMRMSKTGCATPWVTDGADGSLPFGYDSDEVSS